MQRLLVYVGITILIILIIFSAIFHIERFKWLAENCYEIGNISSSTGFGVGMSYTGGVTPVTTFIPGKTGYQCNDGKQYWE